MQQSCESFCSSLRKLVVDATERRWSKQAVSFAEKLVSLSTTPDDVYVLAQALYDNYEYRRAVSLLRAHRLTLSNHKFACLTGRCLLGCKAYEECFDAIGGGDITSELEIPSADQPAEWLASLHVVRAKAWEGLENAVNAVFYYKKALKTDPFCFEAFHSLISRNMLSKADENELMKEIPCSGDYEWIRILYDCLSSKYGDFEKAANELKEVVKSPDVVSPLRPSDQANRSRESGTDSIHTSSMGYNDSTEIGDVEGTEQPRGGLLSCVDVEVAKAEWHYCQGANAEAYIVTTRLIQKMPEALQIYPVHLAACLELEDKTELFLRGQELSKIAPDSAVSFYAFGVYYTAIKNYDEAQKAFRKSIKTDRYFADSWIGLGNAFAFQREPEPVLTAFEAYRKAQNLFPGLHLPSVYLGMENLRLNKLDNAMLEFENAYRLCPGDPTAPQQIGVVEYHRGNYESAVEWFDRAISRIPACEYGHYWEPVYLNLGHALRKLKRYDDALRYYQTALNLRPRQAETLAAIGFVYHLQDKIQVAVDHYQMALIYDQNHTFAKEMFELVAAENLDVPEHLLHN